MIIHRSSAGPPSTLVSQVRGRSPPIQLFIHRLISVGVPPSLLHVSQHLRVTQAVQAHQLLPSRYLHSRHIVPTGGVHIAAKTASSVAPSRHYSPASPVHHDHFHA
jgi:hypothetical protein